MKKSRIVEAVLFAASGRAR